MKLKLATVVLASLAIFAAYVPKDSQRADKLPPPPHSPERPVVTTYHGVQVTSPYRWLDDPASPEVKAWIDAQNKYTDMVFSGFPEGKVLNERVRRLLTTSASQTLPVLAGGTLFYMRHTPPQAQAVLVGQRWPGGEARVLVDPNATGQSLSIGGLHPSPHGRYLAFGTTVNGKPAVTLNVLDVAGGQRLSDTIPDAGGGPSGSVVLWDADERGFIYSRYPVPEELFNIRLYHHTLGDPLARDPIVFGKDYSETAEYRLLAPPPGMAPVLLAKSGDSPPSEIYFRTAKGWERAADTSVDVREAQFVDKRLFVISTSPTPRGRLLALAADGKTTEILPEGARAMHRVAPIEGGFLLTTIWGPDWQLDHYKADGKFVRTVKLPAGIAIGAIASSSSSPETLITYSGWAIPNRWVRYDGRTGAVTTVFEVKTTADYSKVIVHRIEAVSKDGTRFPVSVLALEGTPQDGTAPAILYSYGGFDSPVAPTFIGPYLAWLERGGVFAYANIRGGNEFGESWHWQATLTRKQASYDDFYAAAQALVKERWTSPARLGIHGRSNGGLLMGVALTQHPEQYRAVVAFVGIYDMMRHKEIPNGRYNIPEYGTADDPAQFAAQYSYSGLYHIKKGTAYPAVLLETGVNDPLVAPWQSREFCAALQNATSSGHPVLLLTRFDAGHGSSSFVQTVGNTALLLTFFAHELGLKVVS